MPACLFKGRRGSAGVLLRADDPGAEALIETGMSTLSGTVGLAFDVVIGTAGRNTSGGSSGNSNAAIVGKDHGAFKTVL